MPSLQAAALRRFPGAQRTEWLQLEIV
jgi:hypothetical protein